MQNRELIIFLLVAFLFMFSIRVKAEDPVAGVEKINPGLVKSNNKLNTEDYAQGVIQKTPVKSIDLWSNENQASNQKNQNDNSNKPQNVLNKNEEKKSIFEIQGNGDLNQNTNINKDQPVIVEEKIIDKAAQGEDEVLFIKKQVVVEDHWQSIIQAKERDYEKINQLMSDPKNVNRNVFLNNTFLMLCVMQNDVNGFNLIMEKKPNIYLKNKNNESPIHWAAATNFEFVNRIIEVVHEQGHDQKKYVNEKDVRGRTPLHFAVLSNDNPEIIKSLVSAGSNINAVDAHGDTAAFMAAGMGHINDLVTLAGLGANLNLKNSDDLSAMDLIETHMATENQLKILPYIPVTEKEKIAISLKDMYKNGLP
jgi:ankyrin repeat protein